MIGYILAGLAALGLLYFWLSRRSLHKTLMRMDAGADVIKVGIAIHLIRKYKQEHDDDTAAKLASAVTNEIFSDPPSNEAGLLFLRDQADLIEHEIAALRDNKGVREAITQALRVKAMACLARGERDREHVIDTIEKAKSYGLLIPGGEQPSPETFFPLVERYWREYAPEASRTGK